LVDTRGIEHINEGWLGAKCHELIGTVLGSRATGHPVSGSHELRHE
jgi:hypothetical protein